MWAGWTIRSHPARIAGTSVDDRAGCAVVVEAARALTQRMADEFERSIAAAPSDWHMFQPAWKD